MFEKTLTDLYIERGVLQPGSCPNVLDYDGSDLFILDGPEETQNEKNSRA